MIVEACPLCGSHLTSRSFAVDLDSNFVTVCGVKFKISPQEAEFLYAIDRHRGNFVATDSVVHALWGGGDIPSGADQIISGYAGQLRRFLEPFGVRIESESHRGYRLVAQ